MRSLIKRLAGAALLLWLVVSLVFALTRLAPGDPAQLLVPPGATAGDEARLRAELGLDAPLATQYALWLGRAARGDLGESFASRRPVASVIAEALPVSLAYGGVSLALTFIVGVAVGSAQAVRRGSKADAAATWLTTALYAAPSYWLALGLVALFTYGAARWSFPAPLRLPAFGVRDPGLEFAGAQAAADLVRHAILPVIVLTAAGAAGIARYARSTVGDVLGDDWVRTARAKGTSRRSLFGRHVLANAAAPLVVLAALAVPGILAGSVFVENVFALPGMGRATLGAISARDYPVVLGTTIIYGALVIAANAAADAVLPLLDPRRRGE